MTTISLFGIPAADQLAVADQVISLDIFSIGSPGFDIDTTGIGQLVDIAAALHEVDKRNAKELFRAIADAEVGLALQNEESLRMAQLMMASIIRGVNPADWKKFLREVSKAPRNSLFARPDAIFPGVRPSYPFKPKLKKPRRDSEATTEDPSTGKIFVPEDRSWKRLPGELFDSTSIRVRSKTFVIWENVHGLPVSFIRGQTELLDEMPMPPQSDLPVDLVATLREAIQDPKIRVHNRFILRTRREIGEGKFDHEDYWIALYVATPDHAEPQILIYDDSGEEADEPLFRPFKAFARGVVAHFLEHHPQKNNQREIYHFEVFNVEAVLKKSSARPLLNSSTVQEWPPGSGMITVPTDPSWRRPDPFSLDATVIELPLRRILLHDRIHLTPIDFMDKQTLLLRGIRIETEEDPTKSRSLEAILLEATEDEDLKYARRFILRLYRVTQPGSQDIDLYFTAVFKPRSEGLPPELFIHVHPDETALGVKGFIPFKGFFRALLAQIQITNPPEDREGDSYVLVPLDVKTITG